ncbi:hypothetical protein [Collimonas silvisoli]|uniref:hypothetical protein n=1 Tax=Collimonas silvisoli TaxID=2825884 RepID=UPI001B8AF9E3|nr:hypothetical protein [Collimonas silvisoli]
MLSNRSRITQPPAGGIAAFAAIAGGNAAHRQARCRMAAATSGPALSNNKTVRTFADRT